MAIACLCHCVGWTSVSNIIIFCLNCLLWHRHLLWVFCSVPGGSGQVTFTPTAPFPRKTISLVSPYANLKLINPNVYYMVGRLGTNFGRTVGKRTKEDGKRLQKDILVLCGTSLNYVHIFIFKTLISDKVCIGKWKRIPISRIKCVIFL